jgi:putative peptidoglycan lipid II flippase
MTLVSTYLHLTIFNIVGKGIGGVIPLLILFQFGVSNDLDLFLYAYGLILYVVNIVTPSIESTVIPHLIERRFKKLELKQHLSRLSTIGSLIVIGISVVLHLSLDFFLSELGIFNHLETGEIKAYLTSFALFLILAVWNSFLTGIVNSVSLFRLASVSIIARNLTTILLMLLGTHFGFGIATLITAYTIGEVIRTIVLTASIPEPSLRPRPTTRGYFSDNAIKDVGRSLFYQVAGSAFLGVNLIVDRSMAKLVDTEGSISILFYADRIYSLGFFVLFAGLLPILTTIVSKKHFDEHEHDAGKLFAELTSLARKIGLIAIFLTTLALAMSDLAEYLVYLTGQVDKESSGLLIVTLQLMVVGLAPQIMSSIYSRGLIIMKKTKLMLIVGIIIVFLNVGGNYVFIGLFGLPGIALSTTITHIICAMLFYVGFRILVAHPPEASQ